MKTWFAAAAALFAAGDYAGILMPQYFSVYAVLAVVFAVLMAAAAKFKPQTYGAAILALIFLPCAAWRQAVRLCSRTLRILKIISGKR